MSGFLNEATGRYEALPPDPEQIEAHRQRLLAIERRRIADRAERDLVANLLVRRRMMLGSCLPPGVL